MGKLKFGSSLSAVSSCADMYCLSGYGPKMEHEQLFERVAQIEDLSGIELVGNWHLNDGNFGFIKDCLKKYCLSVCMMVPDLWTQVKWGRGTFASIDKKTRENAVREVKKVMDMAAEIGSNMVDVWLAMDTLAFG